MIVFGLLVGLAFGLLSGALFHLLVLQSANLGIFSFLLPFAQPIAAIFPFPQNAPIWLLFVLGVIFYLLFNTLIFWIFAFFSQRSLTFPTGTNLVPETRPQLFLHGLGFGTAATVNLVIWLGLPASGPIGLLLGIVSVTPILGPITVVRHNLFFQGVLGWMAWFMPISWFSNAYGFIIAIWAIPSGLINYGVTALRFDPTAGVLETRFPYSSGRAFSVGNFTFVNGSNPAVSPGPFLGPSTSSHEVGHAIDHSGMSAFFTFASVVEEQRAFGMVSRFALGQITAESRGGARAARPYTPIWSP